MNEIKTSPHYCSVDPNPNLYWSQIPYFLEVTHYHSREAERSASTWWCALSAHLMMTTMMAKPNTLGIRSGGALHCATVVITVLVKIIFLKLCEVKKYKFTVCCCVIRVCIKRRNYIEHQWNTSHKSTVHWYKSPANSQQHHNVIHVLYIYIITKQDNNTFPHILSSLHQLRLHPLAPLWWYDDDDRQNCAHARYHDRDKKGAGLEKCWDVLGEYCVLQYLLNALTLLGKGRTFWPTDCHVR